MQANCRSPRSAPRGERQYAVGSTRRGGLLALVLAGLVVGCGSDTGPPADENGLVDATPRALAALVIDHVDPGEARRTTGSWSDWNDPPALEAQVDYGVDPEGTESGESRTVRVDVAALSAYDREERRWFECRPEDDGRCEQSEVDGGTLLFRWRPGMEEEEGGGYYWTLVRDDEVVQVAYEESDLFDSDPRRLGLVVDPEDLRAAALDPAMSLRTTPEAWRSGAELDHYEGVESAPEKPEIMPTTPRRLAAVVADYGGIEPDAVRRSRLTDFGPDAVGAHLEFAAGKSYDAFTVDILTTVGRVPQIDPLPCPIQKSALAEERSCFAWTEDSAATWTLASGDRPGVLWIIGAQDDDRFNRVESVGLRVESHGIVNPFFAAVGTPENRLPEDWFGSVYPLTGDLTVGPETQAAR